MTLRVYTAQMRVRDPDALDITRASSGQLGRPFAPSWEILLPEMRARRSGNRDPERWARYVAAYTAEMRESYRLQREAWDALLARERVVLLCYCHGVPQCHRYVLGHDILPRLGAVFEGEIDRE